MVRTVWIAARLKADSGMLDMVALKSRSGVDLHSRLRCPHLENCLIALSTHDSAFVQAEAVIVVAIPSCAYKRRCAEIEIRSLNASDSNWNELIIDIDELAIMEGAGAEVAGIIAISKVAALAYLMFNLYTPPCFAAIGAMNSEMKSGKWVWAGIGLQLGVGYSVGYLVYTIGTLITAPAALNIGAAIGGLAAVLVFAGIIAALIINTNKKMKAEYALGNA